MNSVLMPGPDNLVALIDVLRRFREKRYAIGGDIEEMKRTSGHNDFFGEMETSMRSQKSTSCKYSHLERISLQV